MSVGFHGRRRLIGWSAAVALLLLPLAAMQVTPAMQWDAADFAMFAAMLLAAGIATEIALWSLAGRRARGVAIAAVAFAFVIVWADAAVGVF